MKRLLMFYLLVSLIAGQLSAQNQTVTGRVISSVEGEGAIPGVAVTVAGTTIGTTTGSDGSYTISVPEKATHLVYQFIGMKTIEELIGGRTAIDVVMEPDLLGIEEVVITALGISRAKKVVTYAAQDVDAEALTISGDANIKTSIAGKIAGVQIVGQAGSKLGEAGKIRIRGAVSMTSDADPLYIIDGIPTSDPGIINMNNVESVNVLKGPNATALYGQRAEYGVILITSKKGSKSKGVSVELNSSTTFERVAYLPKYQNKYGQGYEGADEWTTLDFSSGYYPSEWEVYDGEKYIMSGYADESWGPEFDGSAYIPWYGLWPDSPYYGQTARWVAQPDNIKDFYNTGVTLNNSIAINGSSDNYSARVSYNNITQSGIMPYTSLDKNTVSAIVDFSPSSRFSLGGTINFSRSDISGDFDDSYGNQTTGTLNSWWARDVEIAKLRELENLKTTNGYHASWNFWGPYYGPLLGTENGAFWYNPYFWLNNYRVITNTTNLIGDVHGSYRISENIEVSAMISTNYSNYSNHFELPFIIANSSDPRLYNTWNSGFGNHKRTTVENNYSARISYKKKFGDFDVNAFVGTAYRTNSYDRFRAEMELESKTQGLVLPDVFTYSNAKLPVTANTYYWDKKVLSAYGQASIGYRGLVYLDGTYRQDWSSALPSNKNGYGYPSLGTSFIFSELIEENNLFTFGKLRAGWAQVGNDLDALLINPVYPLSASPYLGNPQMYTNATLVDPDIEPAINTSVEAGFDLKFLQNRLGLSFTYFNETREKEIIPVTLSTGTGYTEFLTNAGRAVRTGVEVVLEAKPVQSENFKWEAFVNFGTSNPVIEELPSGLESMNAPGGRDDWDFVTVTHELGNRWGQLRGTSILTDDDGNRVINSSTGMYVTNPGQYLGSVLPDFTGGMLNSFTFFNSINLSASVDFQKGGKFFSLSEMWGFGSGLLEETATVNDLGNPIRDPVSEGGGIHITGVDENGNDFDEYINAHDYFKQFDANVLASEFIHDASYIKLREISLSVNLPGKWLKPVSIKSASVGFVGRNIWLIAVAKDNNHGWDPSELSKTYGENAQMPGTRSYGFTLNLTF